MIIAKIPHQSNGTVISMKLLNVFIWIFPFWKIQFWAFKWNFSITFQLFCVWNVDHSNITKIIPNCSVSPLTASWNLLHVSVNLFISVLSFAKNYFIYSFIYEFNRWKCVGILKNCFHINVISGSEIVETKMEIGTRMPFRLIRCPFDFVSIIRFRMKNYHTEWVHCR